MTDGWERVVTIEEENRSQGRFGVGLIQGKRLRSLGKGGGGGRRKKGRA